MKEKFEKFLDPQKYRKNKVENFLKNISNLYFENFEYSSDKSIRNCIVYIYGSRKTDTIGAKAIAEGIEKVLNTELENIKNKNSSYNYLLDIKNACSNIPSTLGGNSLLTFDPVTAIEALENLQEAFEKASKFSDVGKISFLSDKNVKDYMKTQSNILKKSIENMNKVINRKPAKKAASKTSVKKKLGAIKEKIAKNFLETTKEKMAKNFLEAIEEKKAYFELFPSGSNYVQCNMYLYSKKLELGNNHFVKGAPVVIESLEKILIGKLAKQKYKNDPGYKYLLGIKNACSRFLTVFKKWKNVEEGLQQPLPGIKAFAGVQQAFVATYRFSNSKLTSKAYNKSSNKNESSFLTDSKVIEYLEKQVKILESSTKNLGNRKE